MGIEPTSEALDASSPKNNLAAYRSVGAIRVSNSSNTWDGERSVTPSADET
jgi:hypothetical protein